MAKSSGVAKAGLIIGCIVAAPVVAGTVVLLVPSWRRKAITWVTKK